MQSYNNAPGAHGGVRHIKPGDTLVIPTADGDVRLVFEGKARGRGNRYTVRFSAPNGIGVRHEGVRGP